MLKFFEVELCWSEILFAENAELDLSYDQLMTTENPVLADHLKPVSAQEKANYKAFAR